ncbi:MAG: response regulator transcription factor [Clostridia bacterium]
MQNILVCDDDRDIVAAIKIYLSAEGYKVFEAYNGSQALDIICFNEIHLAIIDVMMPVMDGITAISHIREVSNVPIILLTAKSEDIDKVLGLNIGADDYVTKPFNPVELIARVKAQLRRYIAFGGAAKKDTLIIIGNIELDDNAKTVRTNGEFVSLTPTEYDILLLLMQNPDKVFSSSEIYKNVWNDIAIGAENTVAVHIRHLREKLEINPAEPKHLKVVWGQGYKMERGR